MLASCSLVESLDGLTKADCRDETCDDAGPTTDAKTSSDDGTAPPDDGSSADAGNVADASFVDATTDPDADADAGPECPALPTGWTSVRIADGDAGCTSGFKRTLVDNPRSASGACTCSCQAAPSNPCEYNNGLYSFGVGLFGSSCNYSGNVLTFGCIKNPGWDSNITGVSGTPQSPIKVTCPSSVKRPALTDDGRFDVCPTPGDEKTCGAGACILHESTDATCPEDFPLRRELTDETDIEDTRTCGACSCQTKATACTEASVTLYTDDQCSAGGRKAVFDGVCRAFDSSNFSPKSYQYHATPNVSGCDPASPTTTLTGSVTSKKKVTLCCAGP